MAVGPVKRCCAAHAFHWAATACSATGMVVAATLARATVEEFWPAGTFGPQDGCCDRPRVSEVWFGTAVNGVRFGLSVNAPVIGVAAESSWFIGWMPRICSMVRIIVICE